MPESPLHVLIIGGGLGGLCLAHGLRQAGISVAVYERDATPVIRRQGYRIHIDARGASALRACLPSHLFDLFARTTSAQSHQITVLNKRLKTARVIGSPQGKTTGSVSFSAGVDRLTLREILLADLEENVFFGKEFSYYEQQADGDVQAFFADGAVARGNVLVAADGVNSRVRQQLLPQAALVDTETRCIYGKVLLADATRPLIPECLFHGFTVVAGSRLGMALGLVEFGEAPAKAATQLVPGAQFHTSGDYLMWSLSGQLAQFAISDDELFRLDGTQLHQLALKKIKSWHPNLRALVAASDPAEVFPIAVRVSMPCESWQSGSVTLLGDAIHTMSPAGGSGANMALLDARLLCSALTSVAHKEKSLIEAIHEYEARMLADGFEAVRFSAQGGIFHTRTAPRKTWLQTIFSLTHRS